MHTPGCERRQEKSGRSFAKAPNGFKKTTRIGDYQQQIKDWRIVSYGNGPKRTALNVAWADEFQVQIA
jgi:hypothetical protein